MKKKICLLGVTAICLSLNTNAQIEKNGWLLGGTLQFNGQNSGANGILGGTNGTTSTSNANIAPHIGYVIGKNSVIGLNLAFSSSHNQSQENFTALTS